MIEGIIKRGVFDLFEAAHVAARILGEVLPRGHELTSLAAGRSF